jgi:hypothetical protein
MNDPLYPGFLGRIKQNLGVGNRLPMREPPVIKPHPVRVHQSMHSPQSVSQFVRLPEVERESRHLLPEGVRTVQRIRQRDHLVTGFKQSLRDVTTRVSECPCDGDAHGAATPGRGRPPATDARSGRWLARLVS